MCFLVCASLSAQTLEVSRDKNDNVILVDQNGTTVAGPYVSAEFNQKFNVWTVKTSKGKFGMLSDSGKELLPEVLLGHGVIEDEDSRPAVFCYKTDGIDPREVEHVDGLEEEEEKGCEEAEGLEEVGPYESLYAATTCVEPYHEGSGYDDNGVRERKCRGEAELEYAADDEELGGGS